VFYQLIYPVVRYLAWNRRRPIVAIAVLFIVVAVLARLISGGSGGHSPRPHPDSHPRPAVSAAAAPVTSSAAAAPSPSSSQVPVSPLPVTTGTPPQAALSAAVQFMSVWVSGGPGWAARLRPYVTAGYEAQLSTINPAGNPATAVTGPPAVTSQAPGTVSLSAPTNAGPVLVTVRFTDGRWLADSAMLAQIGN
jgi:hypothetical protein